ncbi:MAG: DUF3810 family protein [Terrimonas sp.]|nr:DUF3810 family protein [Terrimonas sp.]
MKAWAWVLLVLSAIAIKWISLYPEIVEKYYTYGLYPVIARTQRFLLGWIPFSIGDLFYGFLILVVLFKTFQLFRVIFKKQFNKEYLLAGLKQIIFFFLFVYVFFYGLWGLNYSRQGIAKQLGITVRKYDIHSLDTLTDVLISRLNLYAGKVSDEQFDAFRKKKTLFSLSTLAYEKARTNYPFLRYPPKSLKPSLYSYLGNYLGFQGYYNPFSGEGQVNTTVPSFLEPFVSCHEIGHQLGYARENEANFIAFLACKDYDNDLYRYSLYFDLYHYAVSEMYRIDSLQASTYEDKLAPLVKKHQQDYRDFYNRYRNPVEPLITKLYGQYLKANNQPEGKRSYNLVIAWLIAYYQKFGKDAL